MKLSLCGAIWKLIAEKWCSKRLSEWLSKLLSERLSELRPDRLSKWLPKRLRKLLSDWLCEWLSVCGVECLNWLGKLLRDCWRANALLREDEWLRSHLNLLNRGSRRRAVCLALGYTDQEMLRWSLKRSRFRVGASCEQWIQKAAKLAGLDRSEHYLLS